MRIIILALCLQFLSACPITSGSRAYTPLKDSYEPELWSKAKRNVFPDDIRKHKDEYQGQIFVWTGIITSSEFKGDTIITDYEHHYWDWIFDYGIQKEIVFLSPRGEGKFRCYQKFSVLPKPEDNIPKINDMAVIYGKVMSIEADGLIKLDCAPLFRFLKPGKYATDIWDYGKEYLTKRDKNDFRILRVPL